MRKQHQHYLAKFNSLDSESQMVWALKYAEIYYECLKAFHTRPKGESRKEVGKYFKCFEYPRVLWAMFNGHPLEWVLMRETEIALTS